MEVFWDDGFGEGAAAAEFGFEGDGIDDENGGFDLVANDDVVGALVAHGQGDVEHGAAGINVIEFFEGFALGLEIDIEREALVFGIVLVGVFVAE